MNLQQREWFRRAGLLEFFGGAAGRNDTAQQTANAVANMRGDRVDILTKMAKDSVKKIKTIKGDKQRVKDRRKELRDIAKRKK